MKQYLSVHGIKIQLETELDYLLSLLKRDYQFFFVGYEFIKADINVKVFAGETEQEEFFRTPMGNCCLIDNSSIVFYVKEDNDKKFYRREFRKYFTAFISWKLYTNENAICFHSSCVSRNNIGIICMGESGSGKTSIAVELGLNGFDFMSNELTFVSYNEGKVKLLGLPQEINLGDGALEWFEGRYPERFGLLREKNTGNVEYSEKKKQIFDQRLFDRIRASCNDGIILFPEQDFNLETPVYERIPHENVAIKMMEFFLFPSEWCFRPKIKGERIDELESIFKGIARMIPAYHFRWTRDHEKNRKAICQIIDQKDK